MQKEIIIKKLRERGCRITNQRLIIIDIILESECTCCKEIYYKACQMDHKIGIATVYRMINTLEEIGAINRKNMYRLEELPENDEKEKQFTIIFYDNSTYNLNEKTWNSVIKAGLNACGYQTNQDIMSVVLQ